MHFKAPQYYFTILGHFFKGITKTNTFMVFAAMQGKSFCLELQNIRDRATLLKCEYTTNEYLKPLPWRKLGKDEKQLKSSGERF